MFKPTYLKHLITPISKSPATPNTFHHVTRSFTNTAIKQAVIEVTSSDQFKKSISSEKVTIVDFYATWCGPCKAIEPVMEKLSEMVPEAQFLRVDVDQQTEIAADNQITAMPTIKFYKENDDVYTVVGANLQAIVEQIYELTGFDVKKGKQ